MSLIHIPFCGIGDDNISLSLNTSFAVCDRVPNHRYARYFNSPVLVSRAVVDERPTAWSGTMSQHEDELPGGKETLLASFSDRRAYRSVLPLSSSSEASQVVSALLEPLDEVGFGVNHAQ